MNPVRFLLMFTSAAAINFLLSTFFIYAAKLVTDVRLLFTGFVLSIVVTFVFSLLYYKGVPDISWKERIEMIIVWMGLMVIVDTIIFKFMYNGSITDIGMFTIAGYSLSIITLFVSAYLTSNEHPTLSRSPNLMADSTTLVTENKKRLNKKQA